MILFFIQAILLVTLFHPAFHWIFNMVNEPVYSLNMVLLSVLGFAVILLEAREFRVAFEGRFTFRKIPAVILTLSVGAYLVNEGWVGISLVSASLFIMAFYAWLGFYMESYYWKRNSVLVALFVLVLPFNVHLEVFLGYPLRIQTAEWVSQLLQALGYEVARSQTILLLEHKATQVDLPCSGVKSLWTGLLYFLMLTHFSSCQRKVGWFLSFLVFSLFILLGNFHRVLILSFAHLLGAPDRILEVIHVPLGILGFGVACLGAGYCLRRLEKLPTRATQGLEGYRAPLQTPWYPLTLLVLGLCLYSPKAPAEFGAQQTVIQFPENFEAEEIPLSSHETQLFRQVGVLSAHKYSFEYLGNGGSLVWVYSHSWRSQHPPEQCLEASIGRPESSRTIFVGKNPVREVRLKDGRTAYYWFQSRTEITDDYSHRVWRGMSSSSGWVMSSLIVDRGSDSKALVEQILQIVQHHFFSGSQS